MGRGPSMQGFHSSKAALSGLLLTMMLAACSSGGGQKPNPNRPSPPLVTTPTAGTAIISPVTVRGTGVANNRIDASILDETDTVLGTMMTTVGVDGSFSLEFSYPDASPGSDLTLRVVETNDDGASDPTDVALTQLAPPPTPSINSPSASEDVASPVVVTGMGEAGTLVTVRVLDGSSEIGMGSATVSANGSFSLPVNYTPPANGTGLSIEVTLTNDAGASPAASVAVVHQAWTLSGTVTQTDGSDQGTEVQVLLYDSATEVLAYRDVLSITVAENALVTGEAFSFTVANGTYYLRAFRDSDGPFSSGPDGFPTIPYDPRLQPSW